MIAINEYIFRLTFADVSDYRNEVVRVIESNTVSAFKKALATVDKKKALRGIELFDIAPPPVAKMVESDCSPG